MTFAFLCKKIKHDAITFDEFINGEFSYSTFNGSWWSDTELQWENSVMDDVIFCFGNLVMKSP